jgi:hypothetical protein
VSTIPGARSIFFGANSVILIIHIYVYSTIYVRPPYRNVLRSLCMLCVCVFADHDPHPITPPFSRPCPPVSVCNLRRPPDAAKNGL